MLAVEFLGSSLQTSLSEAANPCLRARELLTKYPHDSVNLCSDMSEDALCFAGMNGTSISKRLMHTMKETKRLLVSHLKEWNVSLGREAEPEGFQNRKLGPPLHTTLTALAMHHTILWYLEPTEHMKACHLHVCLSIIVYFKRNGFCLKPLPPPTLKSSYLPFKLQDL